MHSQSGTISELSPNHNATTLREQSKFKVSKFSKLRSFQATSILTSSLSKEAKKRREQKEEFQRQVLLWPKFHHLFLAQKLVLYFWVVTGVWTGQVGNYAKEQKITSGAFGGSALVVSCDSIMPLLPRTEALYVLWIFLSIGRYETCDFEILNQAPCQSSFEALWAGGLRQLNVPTLEGLGLWSPSKAIHPQDDDWQWP